MKIVNNYTLLLIQSCFYFLATGNLFTLLFEENFQKLLYLEILLSTWQRRHYMYNTIITTFWNPLKWKSVYVCVCSCVWLFVTSCTVAHQAPVGFMEFSRQKYWGGLQFPTPGALPNPEIEPMSLVSPVLAERFSTSVPPGKPKWKSGTR